MITKKEKFSFEEKGYLILNWKVSNSLIDLLLDELNGKYRYDSPHYNLNNRIENAFEISSKVRDLAVDKKILDSLLNDI